MITEEKYTLLMLWCAAMAPMVEKPGDRCFMSGVVGLILGNLPENHELLSASQPVAMGLLTSLAIKQLTKLRDSVSRESDV